jgi:hypothetical protein
MRVPTSLLIRYVLPVVGVNAFAFIRNKQLNHGVPVGVIVLDVMNKPMLSDTLVHFYKKFRWARCIGYRDM